MSHEFMEVIVMYILEFLLEHYIMLAELIGLWLLMDSGIHLTKKTILVTRIVIILIFTESVLWSLELWTRSFETLSIARPILSSTIYLLHPAIMIGIIGMGDGIRKQKMWIHIPITISIPLIYTSQWTHLIFWYTADNVYKTVDSFFKYYPYILFFFYAFVLGIFLIENFSLFYRRARKGVFFTLVFSLMGVILHVVVDVDTDYSTLFASALILYYLFLYMNTSKMDPLTRLMNRQCYYADSKKGRERISAVVSVDMNDLKKINDTMGHKAGDEALQTVGRCLNFKAGRAKNVYRIGGDEFAIFYYAKDEAYVQKDIELIKKELSKTPYVCAFGYTMIGKSETIDSAMTDADQKMYQNKAAIKHTNIMNIAAMKQATIEAIHEALNSGMWGMDFDEEGDMIKVEWSQQFRKMIGFDDESDFPNELESWSDRLHPDDKERVLKEFNDTIADYTNQKTYDVEYNFKTKTGQWRRFHAIGKLLRRDNGIPLSYVGMFVDITDGANAVS